MANLYPEVVSTMCRGDLKNLTEFRSHAALIFPEISENFLNL